MTDVEKLVYIAKRFVSNERAEDVAASLNLSGPWISLFLKKHAPELSGKNTEQRRLAAINWLDRRDRKDRTEKNIRAQLREMNVDNELIEFEGLTLDTALCFGRNDVRTIDDLAALSVDEIVGCTYVMADGENVYERGIAEDIGLSAQIAGDLIMRARVHVGMIDAKYSLPTQFDNMGPKLCNGTLFCGRECGVEVSENQTLCRSCWQKTIPASYAAIMSEMQFQEYLGTYDKPKHSEKDKP